MANITLRGAPIKTIGKLPQIGEQVPDFTVTKTDLSEIHLKNYLGKKIILNIFPSLDTSTCATAMLKFNDLATRHPDILVLCISADLPFAQERFCSGQHLQNVQPVSVFRHPDFAVSYGVGMIDGPLRGLLARAVFLIDEHGILLYSQLVSEIADEPDYAKLMNLLVS